MKNHELKVEHNMTVKLQMTCLSLKRKNKNQNWEWDSFFEKTENREYDKFS